MPFFSLTNLNKQFRKVLNYINFWSNTNLGLSTIFLEIIELQKKRMTIHFKDLAVLLPSKEKCKMKFKNIFKI
jgi:hypothetical protein